MRSLDIADDLFRKSGAERWSLSRDEFALALEASIRHAFPDGPADRRELHRYVSGLNVADLAVAAACALGREAAWEHFILEHRPVLYRAADALDPTGGAREIVDSLYADLFGIRDGDGARRSLFRYFHGRSSLATWLRSVLAQRYVDAVRVQKRIAPLPEDEQIVDVSPLPDDPDRARLATLIEQSLHDAVADLPPKDRLRLRSYYVSQLTLAEVGRITGEHEATVSRHLARTRRAIRDAVESRLRDAGCTEAQVARAFELALEDPGNMDLQQVFDADGDRKEMPADRSK